jgi:hypothetical protein
MSRHKFRGYFNIAALCGKASQRASFNSFSEDVSSRASPVALKAKTTTPIFPCDDCSTRMLANRSSIPSLSAYDCDIPRRDRSPDKTIVTAICRLNKVRLLQLVSSYFVFLLSQPIVMSCLHHDHTMRRYGRNGYESSMGRIYLSSILFGITLTLIFFFASAAKETAEPYLPLERVKIFATFKPF